MEKGNKLNMTGGRKYRMPRRKKHEFAVVPIFWSFLLNEVRKGLSTMEEIFASMCISGGCENNGASQGSSAPPEIVGYTGNSPPLFNYCQEPMAVATQTTALNPLLKNLLCCVCIVALLLMGACKKTCPLSLTQEQIDKGWVIVGNDKDCYIEKPDEPEILNPNIADMNDLVAKMDIIERDALAGKKFTLKLMSHLIPTDAQLPVMERLGEVLANFQNVTRNENGYKTCPSYNGQPINFAGWESWGRPSLGMNENVSGGAKADGAMWKAPANEIPRFEEAGQGGPLFNPGPPQTETMLNIKNKEDFDAFKTNALALIQQYGYSKVNWKVSGSGFNLGNGANEVALQDIYEMGLAGISDPVSTNFYKIGWASDSVSTSMGAYNMLYNAKMLKPATWGSYPYISDYTGQVPTGVKIRVTEATPADPNLWTSVFPGTVNCADVDMPLDVSKIPQEFRANWNKNITFIPRVQPEFPNKVPDIEACDPWFLSVYSCTNPKMLGDNNAKFNFITDEPLMLTLYTSQPTFGPKGMTINTLILGEGDHSFAKVVYSSRKANEGNPNPDSRRRPQVNNISDPLPVNTKVTRASHPNFFPSNPNETRPYLVFDLNFRCHTAIMGPEKLSLSNYIVYIDDPNMLWWYNYFEGDITKLFELCKTQINNVSVVFELEPGKEALTLENLYPEAKNKAATQYIMQTKFRKGM